MGLGPVREVGWASVAVGRSLPGGRWGRSLSSPREGVHRAAFRAPGDGCLGVGVGWVAAARGVIVKLLGRGAGLLGSAVCPAPGADLKPRAAVHYGLGA